MEENEEFDSDFNPEDIPISEEFWNYMEHYWHNNREFPESTEASLNKKADLVDGKVPSSQLPSYLDDVLEYDTFESLPSSGEKGKIYVITNNNTQFRWSGSEYIRLNSDEYFMTTNTKQNVTGKKFFITSGGSRDENNTLVIASLDHSLPGVTFYKHDYESGNINFNEDGFNFVNGQASDYINTNAKGFKKSSSNDDYILTGGGGHELKSNYLLSTEGNNRYFPRRLNFYDVIDLNDFTLEGIYYGYQWVNAPISTIAAVTVKQYSNDWIRQEFNLIDGSGLTYVRDRHSGTTWGDWKLIVNKDWIDTQAFFNNNKIESKQVTVVATTLDAELPNGGFITSYYDHNWGGSDKPYQASYGGYLKFSKGSGDNNNLDFYYNNGHNGLASRIWFRTKEAVNGVKPWMEFYHTGNFDPNTKMNRSGDTMTGDINTYSFNSGTDSLGTYFEAKNNVGIRIQYLKNNGNYSQLVVQDTLKFNNNIIWDEGNFNPNSKLNAAEGATTIGFNGNTVDGTPYLYHASGQYQWLATQAWVNSTFATQIALNSYVTLNTPQNINARKSFGGAIDNSYAGAAIEVKGDGNSIYPTISFHQPGLYAGTVSHRVDTFHFTDLTSNGYHVIKTKGFIKDGSNDNYLLLGGGGHRKVNDFIYGSNDTGTIDCYSLDSGLPANSFIPVKSGFYRPNGDNNYGSLLIWVQHALTNDGTYGAGIAFDYAGTDAYITGIKGDGTREANKKIWHEGNLPNPVNQSQLENYHNIDVHDGINNGSDSRPNKTWFDYSWASEGWAGSVINFSGLNGSYSTELFSSYNNPNIIGIRSRNGDASIWNEANYLWHSNNFNPNSKTNALENATGIGFSAGVLPTLNGAEYPYMVFDNGIDYGLIPIATQGWVKNTFATKNELGNYVTLGTQQIIDGFKEFTQPIRIPSATDGDEAVNYNQLTQSLDWYTVRNYDGLAKYLGFTGANIANAPYIRTSTDEVITLATEKWSYNNFVSLSRDQNIDGRKRFTNPVRLPEAINNDEAVNYGQATELALDAINTRFLTRSVSNSATYDLSGYGSPKITNIICKGNGGFSLDIDGFEKGMTVKISNTAGQTIDVNFNNGSVSTAVDIKNWAEFHVDSEGDIIRTDANYATII